MDDANTEFKPYSDASTVLNAEHNIGLILRCAHGVLQRVIDQQAVPLGLTAHQWRPLLLIAFRGIDTPAQLARCVGIDTAAITRALDRLQAKGLLERSRCQEDRRVVRIALTEAGQQAASAMLPLIAESLNIHLQGFSPAELDILRGLLQRMIANGERHLRQQTGAPDQS